MRAGTTNFVHRFPFVCVSIGLAADGTPVLGVVFNPILGELFTAIKGQGAFLNGARSSAPCDSTTGLCSLARGTSGPASVGHIGSAEAEVAAGRPIACSTASDLGSALLATEVGVTRDPQTADCIFGRMQKTAMSMRSLRCLGSCALDMCSVACGRVDAMYEVGFGGWVPPCWLCCIAGCSQEPAGRVATSAPCPAL